MAQSPCGIDHMVAGSVLTPQDFRHRPIAIEQQREAQGLPGREFPYAGRTFGVVHSEHHEGPARELARQAVE